MLYGCWLRNDGVGAMGTAWQALRKPRRFQISPAGAPDAGCSTTV
jgi:hypothetical protein